MAKMTSRQLANHLKSRLTNDSWTHQFDREKDTLRIEDKQTGKGITLELPQMIAKWEVKPDETLDEIIYYVKEALSAMKGEAQHISGKEKQIYPVIRSTSFPETSSDEIPLVFDEHTAETRIYYALDLGSTYRLIDEKMLQRENWTKERIRETASFNVRSLETVVKMDEVAGNRFYFFRANDGYDASRLLNESILQEYAQKIEGQMAISVPHQDVFIIADVRNESGYDILGQMSMSFFASGTVPITALSFLYDEGKLEPIFILAKSRPKQQ
ncbi:DUF1444 domain-containing protein [Bacillus sp. FJAT-53060]|uniref:DUF1444 domain-containing protein n=1 Tax=Bacillus TaxID=1386 RepID=UPI001CFA7FDC|nr:DUF1444 domain-containing protein [Bacillus stratosphericus]